MGGHAHASRRTPPLLIHEVGHLLRDHEERKKAADARHDRLWNTAGDCEINDDLAAEGLPLPGDPPLPANYGLQAGESAEVYYHHLFKPVAHGRRDAGARGRGAPTQDCGSGAHGERRSWELPTTTAAPRVCRGVDR